MNKYIIVKIPFIAKPAYFRQSFLYSLLLCAVFSVGLGLLAHYLFDLSLGKMSSLGSWWQELLWAVILAPIVETFLFQWMVIQTVEDNSKWRYKKKLAIILSGVFFGLIHFYHPVYMLFTFLLGLILAERFYYFRDRTNYFSAFVYISLIHALMNLEVAVLTRIL